MSIAANDWIAHHARVSPHREAIYDLASGRRFSYAQFDERITRLALYLQSLGIAEGDRVAVLSHNDPDVFEIQFASARLGAIFLPLNWRLAVPELEFICNDATPKVLVYGIEFAGEAVEVARLSNVPHTIDIANGGDSAYESGIAAALRRAGAADKSDERRLDRHVHFGHDRAAQGRDDHLCDVRL